MKKYLLLLVSALALAFNASAGGGGTTQLTYYFTFRATVEATGNGKAYISFDNYDEARNNQSTVAEKHWSTDQASKPSVYNDGDVHLYYTTAADEGYVFKALVNKATGKVVKRNTGFSAEGRIEKFKSWMMCGQFDDEHEADCIAQHTEAVNNHVDSAYIAVFRPAEVTPATVSFDKESGRYEGSVQVNPSVAGCPEFCKVMYKIDKTAANKVALAEAPAGFAILPEEGLTITESCTLTVAAVDELTGEIFGSNEIQYTVLNPRVTGISVLGKALVLLEGQTNYSLTVHKAFTQDDVVVSTADTDNYDTVVEVKPADLKSVDEYLVVVKLVSKANAEDVLVEYTVNVSVVVPEVTGISIKGQAVELAAGQYNYSMTLNEEFTQDDVEVTVVDGTDFTTQVEVTPANVEAVSEYLVDIKLVGANNETFVNYTVNVTVDTATGINDINVTGAKAGKFIENGQVVIVKGDKKFNAAGQAIK